MYTYAQTFKFNLLRLVFSLVNRWFQEFPVCIEQPIKGFIPGRGQFSISAVFAIVLCLGVVPCDIFPPY